MPLTGRRPAAPEPRSGWGVATNGTRRAVFTDTRELRRHGNKTRSTDHRDSHRGPPGRARTVRARHAGDLDRTGPSDPRPGLVCVLPHLTVLSARRARTSPPAHL